MPGPCGNQRITTSAFKELTTALGLLHHHRDLMVQVVPRAVITICGIQSEQLGNLNLAKQISELSEPLFCLEIFHARSRTGSRSGIQECRVHCP